MARGAASRARGGFARKKGGQGLGFGGGTRHTPTRGGIARSLLLHAGAPSPRSPRGRTARFHGIFRAKPHEAVGAARTRSVKGVRSNAPLSRTRIVLEELYRDLTRGGAEGVGANRLATSRARESTVSRSSWRKPAANDPGVNREWGGARGGGSHAIHFMGAGGACCLETAQGIARGPSRLDIENDDAFRSLWSFETT